MRCKHKGKVPVLNYLVLRQAGIWGEWMYRSTFFLNSALAGDEWLASRPARFTPGERIPGIHWIGSWVGPRAGLDDEENRKFLNLMGLEIRPLGRPVRNQSLYRLRYPCSRADKVSSWMLCFSNVTICLEGRCLCTYIKSAVKTGTLHKLEVIINEDLDTG
jgi:hypothetical protein